MNNKEIGNEFEKQMLELLAKEGYWVHFLYPSPSGSQPFDIIAVKDGEAIAMDCKTCEDKIFRISRLEYNQLLAFDKWLACGNGMPLIAVLHRDVIKFIEYTELKMKGAINLE